MADGAAAKIRDAEEAHKRAGNFGGGIRRFKIWTPPHEVAFWYSLHTPERTREFEAAWAKWFDAEIDDAGQSPSRVGLELSVGYPETPGFKVPPPEEDE